jgi:predicted nucleotidyltransferase
MIIPVMGTTSRLPPTAGLAEVLFTPVQQRVLGLLFGQPDRSFQSAELIRLADSGTGAVHRLLQRLEQSQLVLTHRVGNQKHYQANHKSPIFVELNGLITKTAGLATPVRAALSPLADRIHGAFIYGSIAKGTDRASSDVDLMVVADKLDYSDVYSALETVEAQLGRKINPSVMSLAEWRRKRRGSGFAARIAEQSRMFVIGAANDID